MRKTRIFSLAVTMLAASLTACSPSPTIVWNSQESDSHEAGTSETTSGSPTEETEAETVATVYLAVDICGAVARPGVYYLSEGARVCDVVDCAGGLLSDADTKNLNQAAYVNDGDKIIVYTIEETAAGTGAVASGTQTMGVQGTAAQTGMVNINTADVTQLCTLSGIGESRAQDIIAYRESNGGFQSIEEIMNVSGIKEATFSKIKDDIVVK